MFMKNDNWSVSESRVKVSSRLPPCPATSFTAPEIKSVAIEIDADDHDFIPTYPSGENAADLLANIPNGEVSLSSGSSEIVDCGFSMKIPAGYKCSVSSVIPNLFMNFLDSDRVEVRAFNAGDETVLHHKQIIGKIWVEPVYLFEWRMRG